MVSDEKLREWVERKLDDGVSRERIKESLKDTGHNPSIVDNLDNPFDSEPEEVQNHFKDTEGRSVDLSSGQDSGNTSTETSDRNQSRKQAPNTEDKTNEQKDFWSSGPNEPVSEDSSFELPELPKFSFDIPLVKIAGIVVLLAGVGAALYFQPFDVQMPSQSQTQSASTGGEMETSANCDVGLRINSISNTDGRTTVEVEVTRGSTSTRLELYNQDRLVGERTETFSGIETFSFDGKGNHADFSAVNCGFSDTLTIG